MGEFPFSSIVIAFGKRTNADGIHVLFSIGNKRFAQAEEKAGRSSPEEMFKRSGKLPG